jgi:AcrR family transcriptional regulator
VLTEQVKVAPVKATSALHMAAQSAHELEHDADFVYPVPNSMIVRDEQRERVIGLLAEHLLATGLGQASLRQLATAAGVSDRMLLYYFRDKTEILSETMARIASQIATSLAQALPDGALMTASALACTAATITSGDEVRPFMRLWIEVVAAAARNEQPFVEIAQHITAGFLQWIEARLDPTLIADRAATAAMIFALIDGFALMDICVGREHATAAAAILRDIRWPESDNGNQ